MATNDISAAGSMQRPRPRMSLTLEDGRRYSYGPSSHAATASDVFEEPETSKRGPLLTGAVVLVAIAGAVIAARISRHEPTANGALEASMSEGRNITKAAAVRVSNAVAAKAVADAPAAPNAPAANAPAANAPAAPVARAVPTAASQAPARESAPAKPASRSDNPYAESSANSDNPY